MTQKRRAMLIGLDGADPFVIRKLINQGKLPNLKRAIEEGVSREDWSMIGALPSVTPPNWCSMATGNWPRTHGVTCYNNHTLGKDLQIIEHNWDSRRAESEFIWERFSRAGKKSIMLNYCEAWPPRFDDQNSIYIDGSGVIPFMRCNLDYQKLITMKDGDFKTVEQPHAIKNSNSDCVIEGDQFEKMLKESGAEAQEASAFEAQFDPVVENKTKVMYKTHAPEDDGIDKIEAAMKAPENWGFELPESAKVIAINVNDGLTRRYVVLSAEDGTNYDTITIYANRKENTPLCTVKNKEWAFPVYDTYTDPKTGNKTKVAYGVRVINIEKDGSFAEVFISHAINVEDYRFMYPHEVGQKLYEAVGPMLPFCKFGRHRSDCADVLLESIDMMNDWHIRATDWLTKEACPDCDLFYVHLHSIDFYNHWYLNFTLPGSCDNWADCQAAIDNCYEINDKYIGYILDNMDEDTAAFITSDHGAVPCSLGNSNPGIGSLTYITSGVMADLGLTVLTKDEEGNDAVDWSKTKAVYQRSSYVYLNVKGRDPYGIIEPEDYDKTVAEVIDALYSYRHPESGDRVVAFCMTRDEMEIVGMGGPHVGDILVQLVPTYNKEHAYSPTTCQNEGCSLNCTCLMIGSGFKKHATINRPIRIVDVVPTICYLTDTPVPSNVEGGVIWQALEGFEEKQY